MPLILGTNSIKDTGYNVANSCRFNDGSSDHMLKTAAAGNRRTFTFSTWFKRGQLSTNQQFFTSYSAGNAGGFAYMQLEAPESGIIGDRISLEVYGTILLKTNQVLRDPSAWYHLVIAVDTTNATANNRCRMYLNGTEITSFATRNNPDENFDFAYNQDSIDLVLASNNYNDTKGNYFDGYLAETVWIDGTQYAASDFGEFDDSGIWKPIDVSGLTFGTNGFYLDYEASGNLGNDANGGTDLTEANLTAIDQTTDTCTNNFATLNPLSAGVGDVARIPTFSEGNTKFTAAGADTFYQAISTFGAAVGKWYFEVKVASDQDLDKLRVGYWNIDKSVASGEIQDVSAANSGVFYMNKDGGEMRLNATSTTADYGTFGDNELMGVAIDMDAQTITILKANSVIVNAYDYSGGIAAGTVLTPAFMGYDDTAFQVNYGNPHEANSSDAADGNGYGAFEFAPPSGYFSWCTKNLAEHG